DTLVGRCEQHAAPRGFCEGIANRCGDGASAVLVSRHAKLRRSSLVETAAGAVARLVHGARDRVLGLHIALQPARAAGIGAGARRGCLAAHEGRQKTPVEETAKTNLPSWAASRARTACHHL